jgi:hypothetical protein
VIEQAKQQYTGPLEMSGERSGEERLKDEKESWQTAKSHLKQADHVTLNFNNNMSTVGVWLNIQIKQNK